MQVVARGLGCDSTSAILDESDLRLLLAVVRVAEGLARDSGRPIRWPPEVAEIVHSLEILAANARTSPAGSGGNPVTRNTSATTIASATAARPDAMLTASEVAAALGVSPRRVRQRAVELGGVRLGRDWHFPPNAAARKAG